MKPKNVYWTITIALLAAATLLAQNSTQIDPVSGNWGDPAGPGFNLKFDGKIVSGTIRIVNPAGKSIAPIETGTFDPQTRVLRLEGKATAPEGGSALHFLIEGKISNGKVAGTYHFGPDQSGDFTFDRVPGGF